MPKVWLPKVPLVVAPSTLKTGPDWPAMIMVPRPQPMSWSAMATLAEVERTATARSFFIMMVHPSWSW
jgi:hypothetical protein